MSTKDKELLIRDLSARLPYGVIVHLKYDENTSVTREMGLGSLHDIMFDSAEGKPYLRPMSSMTDGERKEYELLANHCIVTSIGFIHLEAAPLTDWLNAYHFDYRGLIEKNLALEAPKGMYNIKKK